MKMKMKGKGKIWLIGYFSLGEETSGASDDVIQKQFYVYYMVSRNK